MHKFYNTTIQKTLNCQNTGMETPYPPKWLIGIRFDFSTFFIKSKRIKLELFFKKKTKERFSKTLLENIDGTIHEKQGAAELLIIWLYESLTSKWFY